ncbi:hypothetical protein [Methylomusa anaerophila]|nr:hypothetical protein [Methylomusa anaerophila]
MVFTCSGFIYSSFTTKGFDPAVADSAGGGAAAGACDSGAAGGLSGLVAVFSGGLFGTVAAGGLSGGLLGLSTVEDAAFSGGLELEGGLFGAVAAGASKAGADGPSFGGASAELKCIVKTNKQIMKKKVRQ